MPHTPNKLECSLKLKMYQNRFRSGSAPDPAGELTEYDAPPDLLIGWRGEPLPILFPFDAFAVFELPEGVGRV